MPRTGIVRIVEPRAPLPSPARPPAAGGPRPAAAPDPGPEPRSPAAAPAPARAAQAPPADRGAKLSIAMGLLLLLSGLGTLGYRWNASRRPEKALPRLARQYLAALRGGDFDAAYGLLTEASRRHCSLDDFRAARDGAPWEFSDIRLVGLEGDAAVLRYTLHAQGRPAEEDFLLFVREGGRWARPFVWNLFNGIEEALDRGDADRGLRLAQAAIEVNPRDARAQAYLCEAVYYRKDASRLEAECVKALELSKRYPSKLSPRPVNERHLHALLGDAYRNWLARPKEAAESYTSLLGHTDASPEDRCAALLGRGESRLALSDFAGAAQDAAAAGTLCAKAADMASAHHLALAAGRARPPAAESH